MALRRSKTEKPKRNETQEALEHIWDEPSVRSYFIRSRDEIKKAIIKLSHYTTLDSQKLGIAALHGRLELVNSILSEAQKASETKEKQ